MTSCIPNLGSSSCGRQLTGGRWILQHCSILTSLPVARPSPLFPFQLICISPPLCAKLPLKALGNGVKKPYQIKRYGDVVLLPVHWVRTLTSTGSNSAKPSTGSMRTWTKKSLITTSTLPQPPAILPRQLALHTSTSTTSDTTTSCVLSPLPTFKEGFGHSWSLLLDCYIGEIPPTASLSCRYLFYLLYGICSCFLLLPLVVSNPFYFQKTMHYHLHVASIMLAVWGGVYQGLSLGRWGNPFSLLSGWPRFILFCYGPVYVATLAFTYANIICPWTAYLALAVGQISMVGGEYLLHRYRVSPRWLFKWTAAAATTMTASLLLARWRGRRFEESMEEIILSAPTEPSWRLPDSLRRFLMG